MESRLSIIIVTNATTNRYFRPTSHNIKNQVHVNVEDGQKMLKELKIGGKGFIDLLHQKRK